LESQKLRQNELGCLSEGFADFQGAFFKKPLEARFGTQFQLLMKKIKARQCRAFCARYQLGLSAPNPDTRNFSGKVSWNFKSFSKIKWYI